METIEVKWAIHEDVVAMEHSLKVIASVRPCSHCDGTGVEPLTERVACCHCDGHRTVPVLSARDAAQEDHDCAPPVGGAKACWCDTLGDTETQGGNLVMPTAAAQIVSANYTQYDAGYGARGMRLVSGVGSELSFHTGWIGDGDNGLIVEVICRHGFHETFYLTDAATDVERLDLLINVLKTAQAVLSLRAANSEMEEAE